MDRPDDVLAGVVEQLPIGVFALDPDGRVVLWNRRAEQLTGWDRADTVGVGLLDTPVDTPVDTPSIVRILDELRAGRPFTGRFPVRAGAGPTLYFRAVPTTLSGTAVPGVLQDVVDSRAGGEAFALLDALCEHALAEATVPGFADVCRVYLVDPARGRGTVTGRRSVSRTGPGLPDPPMTDTRFVFAAGHPFARAVRSAAPVLADLPTVRTRGWEPTPQTERWAAEIGAHSVLVAPVVSGGEVVAALLFMGCADRPRHTEDDLGLVGKLGVRASAAVGRSMAFHRRRQVAVALQSAMLTEPPSVPGCEIEARYLPAAAGLAVGGDWFDAFVLPGGDLAVGVGDVAGHDLSAAATMGQLRSMLRALADGTVPPSTVVSRLDRVATRLGVTRFTTPVHGQLVRSDPARTVFRWSNAGHPPPILVSALGDPRFLTGAVGIVLGVAPESPRHDSEVTLPPGCALLPYTDGLVERRRDPDNRAVAELLDLVRAHAGRPLGEFCDHLVRCTAADTDDDIAVLAVRIS